MPLGDVSQLPPLNLLQESGPTIGDAVDADLLTENARMLESVLEDFGVRGEIMTVRPGPVVTLYELQPAHLAPRPAVSSAWRTISPAT